MNWKKINRQIHYWGSAIIIIPVVIVIGTGLLLQVKKQITWVQPATVKTQIRDLTLNFDQLLTVAKSVKEAEISSWKDVDRLDVRPGKGVTKIRAKNRWEIQVHNKSAEILAVNYRRSDLIESIHDGSWFHDDAKLWLFLPAAIILLVLSLTGLYMFLIVFPSKLRNSRRKRAQINNKSAKPI
jgi:uncharacterized iron-regulated membrane protein